MLAGPGARVGSDAVIVLADAIAEAGQPRLPLPDEDIGDGAVEFGAAEVSTLLLGPGAAQIVTNAVDCVRGEDILAPDGVAAAGGEFLAFEQIELVDVIINVGIPLGEG